MSIDDQEKDYGMQLILIIACVVLIGVAVWWVTMPKSTCDIAVINESCANVSGIITTYNDGLYCSSTTFAYHLNYNLNGSCQWTLVSID